MHTSSQRQEQINMLEQQMKDLVDLDLARHGACMSVMTAIAHEINVYMRTSTADWVTMAKESELHKQEVIYTMSRRAIEHLGASFEKIIENETTTAREQRDEIRHAIQYILPQVFGKTLTTYGRALHDKELGNIYRRLFEESSTNTPYYELASSSKDARVTELTVKDVPAVVELYKGYQLDELNALNIANGRSIYTTRTFMYPPEHEEHEITQKLEQTEALKGKRTQRERRKLETMHGKCLWSPGGELLGVSIHTVGPMNPKHDPRYLEEQEEYLTHGPSGGRMTFTGEPEEKSYSKILLEGVNSRRLYIIIGAARGAALRVMSENILQMEKDKLIRNDNVFTAYVLNAIRMSLNGEPVQTDAVSIGQNVGSYQYLTHKFAYRAMPFAYDEDTTKQAHAVRFDLQGGNILTARPLFSHFGASGIDIIAAAHRFAAHYRGV